MIPFLLFFAALVVLTATDAWTTYKGLKSGAGEANPVIRKLVKAVGVKEALTLVKVGCLVLVWTYPPTSILEQCLVLGMYAAVTLNNVRVLRKTGVL